MSARTLFRSSAAIAARQQTSLGSSILRKQPFSQTAMASLKESNSADPNPDEYERHKHDSINKAKSGQGQWKPELASNSEENIRADRLHHGSSKEDMKKLQEETKHQPEKNVRSGEQMKQ
ncbi:hypothetical protein QBC42DRAFT_260064 [Cladorrhinum samala]|uniref:Uncharacterized protein n=1 Tax=Cladorrhinum samala TaxID=585594 RepID=A0AAV9HYU5_9PEZI|nr:hypothetical protein QBC42DRAFT_260064 [Cladorrhinum samala]